MKEQRAKTLIRLLAELKLDVLVGVETFPAGADEWRVAIKPGQITDVVAMGMNLHFHGFGCKHGPVQGAPQQPNGMPGETFVFEDNLPEMLPLADEVEEIGPDDFSRVQVFDAGGMRFGWTTASAAPPPPGFDFDAEVREAQARQQRARTGGERIWAPGTE